MTTKSERTGRFIGGFKRLVRDGWRSTKVVTALLIISILSGLWFQWAETPAYAETPMATSTPATVDKFESKIEDLKLGVVKQVEKCEAMGHKESDGLITIDNNKAGTLKGEDVFSHGTLQFKVKTVKYFVKMRDGKGITSKDAIELALDQTQAEQLAKYVMFNVKDGWTNWLNCGTKLNVAEQVSLIKNLEN